METRLRTYMGALRVLAKSNDLNQVILVERNIDEFLQTNAEQLAHALERLRNAIHAEEVANRSGEDGAQQETMFGDCSIRCVSPTGANKTPDRAIATDLAIQLFGTRWQTRAPICASCLSPWKSKAKDQ
jgi:hypothetical protein